MKVLLAGICGLVLSSIMYAQEGTQEVAATTSKSSDPSGKWTWTQDMRGNKLSFELVLAKKDDALTGTFKSIFPNPPENFPAGMSEPVKIEDGKYDGDKITFKVIRSFNGNEFATRFAGTLKGDQIVGTRTANFGGDDRESEWIAKRAGLTAAEVVGDWKILINTPNGEIEEKLSFTMDGDELAGVFHSSFFGDSKLKDVKIEGDRLLFGVEFSNNDFSMDIDYDTKPEGDKITGKASFEVNGEENNIDVKGSKVETKADTPKAAE